MAYGGGTLQVVGGFLVEVATLSTTIEKWEMLYGTMLLMSSHIITMNNVSVFTSKEFNAFLASNGIKKITSAPY